MGDHMVSADDDRRMQCPQCGHPQADAARFCEQCGVPLPLRCPACGETNSHIAQFCANCGTAFGARGSPAPRPASATVAAAAPEGSQSPKDAPLPSVPRDVGSAPSLPAYTPAYLVEKILTTRIPLVGERKLVTGLFADAADS